MSMDEMALWSNGLGWNSPSGTVLGKIYPGKMVLLLNGVSKNCPSEMFPDEIFSREIPPCEMAVT